MKRSKRLILLLCLISVGLLIFTYSLTNDEVMSFHSNKLIEEQSNQQIELRMMWWGDQERADRTIQVIERFELLHPHIDIIYEFEPSSAYWNKLNTQLAAGIAPDLFFLGGNVKDYAEKGVLLPLDSFVGKELQLDDVDASMIEYGTVDDQLVHISAGANARGIVINKTMFERAGLKLPEDNWDWNSYADTAKQISELLGEHIYGTYDFTYEGMEIYFKQHGQQLVDYKSRKLGFELELAKQWFRYWEKLSAEGVVVPIEEAIAYPSDDMTKNLITVGRAAMTLLPSNQLTTLQSYTSDELILRQLPRGPKGTGVVFESSQGLSGYAQTAHPKEVAMFISYFINDKEAAQILGSNRGVPVTAHNREMLTEQATNTEREIYQYTSIVSEATKKEPFQISYNLPGIIEYEKMVKQTLQEIRFGRKSVDEAVNSFFDEAQRIISSNASP